MGRLSEHDIAALALRGLYVLGELRMSDDKSEVGAADRQRINLNETYEVRDWSAKFGVSEEQLREAVARVGNMADDVERELRG